MNFLFQLKKLFTWRKPKKALTRNVVVGRWGEDQAVAFLKRAGFRIIGRNVRSTRHDELDIIAKNDTFLVFVEVKTREQETFGSPAKAITPKKRHALNRAAAAYLRKAHYPDCIYRFDVVEVVGLPEMPHPLVRHIEHAFPFERQFS